MASGSHLGSLVTGRSACALPCVRNAFGASVSDALKPSSDLGCPGCLDLTRIVIGTVRFDPQIVRDLQLFPARELARLLKKLSRGHSADSTRACEKAGNGCAVSPGLVKIMRFRLILRRKARSPSGTLS